jgi:hypothetical protein
MSLCLHRRKFAEVKNHLHWLEALHIMTVKVNLAVNLDPASQAPNWFLALLLAPPLIWLGIAFRFAPFSCSASFPLMSFRAIKYELTLSTFAELFRLSNLMIGKPCHGRAVTLLPSSLPFPSPISPRAMPGKMENFVLRRIACGPTIS